MSVKRGRYSQFEETFCTVVQNNYVYIGLKKKNEKRVFSFEVIMGLSHDGEKGPFHIAIEILIWNSYDVKQTS